MFPRSFPKGARVFGRMGVARVPLLRLHPPLHPTMFPLRLVLIGV